MISMNSATPPTPLTPELLVVANLLEMLGDPKAYQAKVSALISATTNHDAAAVASRKALEKLQGETAAASAKIEADRAKAADEIARQRTALDVAALAQKQRADANDKRSAELDTKAKALAEREAAIAKREAAFKQAANQLSA